MKIYYFRHGKTTYEPDCLTEEGKQEALALRKSISNIKFDKIFVSPSGRAIETAKIALDCKESIFNIIDFVDERHAWQYFSIDYNNLRSWLFFRKDLKTKMLSLVDNEKWFSDNVFSSMPINDAFEFFGDELDKWFESIGFIHDRKNQKYIPVAPKYKNIALFAHSGFGIVFLTQISHLLIPNACCKYEEMSNCGCTIYDIDDETGKITIEIYDKKISF